MAYGLSEEEAISAVSLNSAKIMGVGESLGSLEVGKTASLFVSDGDALDMRTNNVILAMIAGEYIALTNHQLELYQRFKKKYQDQ